MRAALDIALKDLRRMIRDRSALLIGLVAPFALAALFATILGGIEGGFHARWSVVDSDGGPIAESLREGPMGAMAAAGLVTLETLPSEAAARSALAEGRTGTAILIPAGFSADVMAGSPTSVEILVDADAELSAQVAAAMLTTFAHEVEAVRLAMATTLAASGQPPDASTIAAVSEAARALPAPITVRDAVTADRRIGNTTYYAAAMAILFVFLTAQMGITSLHAERRQRTLARMLAAPIPWWGVVLGKIVVSLALALLSMSVIVAGTSLLLGARFGEPLAVAALLVGAALAATGVALLVVSFTRTEEQAGSAIAVVSMLLAILGGSFFPPDQGPEALAQLSLLTPHAWFLRGVGDTAAGAGMAASAGPVAVLVLIGLVFGGLGLLRMRRLVLG